MRQPLAALKDCKMNGSMCTLLPAVGFTLVWLYLLVAGAVGGVQATMRKGDEAPRNDAWIAFGLAYSGLFVGVIPVLIAGVLRGRLWPTVNFDDDTVGTILLDDTTSRLITVQLFMTLLIVMFFVVIFGLIFSSAMR